MRHIVTHTKILTQFVVVSGETVFTLAPKTHAQNTFHQRIQAIILRQCLSLVHSFARKATHIAIYCSLVTVALLFSTQRFFSPFIFHLTNFFFIRVPFTSVRQFTVNLITMMMVFSAFAVVIVLIFLSQ